MISIVLRNINDKFKPIPNFKIHVGLDGCIFLDKIEKLINDGNSVFVMVPIRLGLDSIQPAYLHQVKCLFEIPENVGIAGGKDHMALYFVGTEDINNPKSGLFYLDPHLI